MVNVIILCKWVSVCLEYVFSDKMKEAMMHMDDKWHTSGGDIYN